MDNSKKVIYDLCGGTGAWSEPYRAAGYDVRIVTLPHLPLFEDKPGDVLAFDLPAKEDVYGILAAVPCTEFSVAKTNGVRDYKAGLLIVNAVLKIVWKARLNNKLAFWAVENPVGHLRQFIGKAPYKFEQWEFGDDGIKPTEIWGYFNFPKKTVTEKPLAKYLKHIQKTNGLSRKAVRAITPKGFAEAFYKVNK